MSLCCFPLFRAPRLKKVQSERGFSCFRCWRKRSPHQHLPPPGKIHPEKSKENIIELADGFPIVMKSYVREVHQARNTVRCQSENTNDGILEELVHNSHFKIYRVKVQVHQTDTTIKPWSQSLNDDILEEMVNGYNYSTLLNKRKVREAADTSTFGTEGAAEFNFHLRDACRIRSLQGGTVKKLVEFETPDFPSGNVTLLSTFRTRHMLFSRANILLDNLLSWSCPLPITSETIKVFSTPEGLLAYNDHGHSTRDQIKRAIAFTVGAWPDQDPGLGLPLRLRLFCLKLALEQVSFPTSQQLCQAHRLWILLENLETTVESLEDAPPEFKSNVHPQERPAQEIVPGAARGLALAFPGLKLYLKPGWTRLFEPLILLS